MYKYIKSRYAYSFVLGVGLCTLYLLEKSESGNGNSTSLICDLFIAGHDLDLGTVSENAAFVHYFSIKNLTNETIKIVSVSSSCDCASLTPAQNINIEPGNSVRITAKLRLQARFECGGGSHIDLRAIPIHILYDKGNGVIIPSDWQIHCRILQSILPNSISLDFGLRSLREAKISRVFEIQTASHIGAVYAEESDYWSVKVVPIQPLSSRKYNVEVVWRGAHPPGSYTHRIGLIPIAMEGDRLPKQIVPIKIELVQDITTIPRIISLGRHQTGTVAEEALRFNTFSEMLPEILSWSTNNQETVIEKRGEGNDPRFIVRQKIVHEGESTAHIEFKWRDDTGQIRTLPVVVSYLGFSKLHKKE